MVYLKCRFRFIGMQFVRQKLKIFITWSIFIQIEKMTPQNRKSQRAQYIGQGPKLQKIHFWSEMQFVRQKPEGIEYIFGLKNIFGGVTKF